MNESKKNSVVHFHLCIFFFFLCHFFLVSNVDPFDIVGKKSGKLFQSYFSTRALFI